MMSNNWSRDQITDVLVRLEQLAESRLQQLREHRLVSDGGADGLTQAIAETFDFKEPQSTAVLIESVLGLLEAHDLDSTHPRYFGLFNPAALPIGAVADALVAMLNPQVGTRGHAPAAVALEDHALAFFAARIGYDVSRSDAHFTSGGQEANTTAVAVALNHVFPNVAVEGVRALSGQPTLYVSDAAHHSFQKAAKLLGLGVTAVREVASGADGAMSVEALAEAVMRDRNAGALPFLVVGTAGSTGTGSIDQLAQIADVAEREELWFHTDAAWGGGALMSDRLRQLFAGIERADSVTWDAHKWLSVPMGAGMVFFRERADTANVFSVTTGYVPTVGDQGGEPYLRTLQWSRRFIGLKVLMALAQLGLSGYQRMVEHQVEMGDLLRDKLLQSGWQVRKDSALPVVCFEREGVDTEAVVAALHARGQVWVSSIIYPHGASAIRACITSYDVRTADLDALVAELALATDNL